jgi:aspartate beta-hydroxylase
MTENPAALLASARRAMSAGDFATAQSLLLKLVAFDKRSIPGWLNLAAVRRQLNDANGAHAALREALRLEPRNFHALLMTATLLERDGAAKAAASAYGAALANAPPDQYLDQATLQAVQHARTAHSRYTSELSEFIRSRIGDAQTPAERPARRRIEAFIDTTLRTRKRYQQEPLEYYFPGLAPIEFYERDEFPWLPEFESATADIQKELVEIVREEQAAFEPYIHYDDHLPLDQWRELNHSPRWSAYHFYERGQRVEERCRRAPATMAAIAKLPQAQVPQRSPSALFSVLQPRTRIPPHTGVANFRLVVHLPLIVPPGCGFRVGGETREWRTGEAWVFDDTIEHEAWNDSDETRIILICDVWNPRLSIDEREAIGQIIAATDEFTGTKPNAQI